MPRPRVIHDFYGFPDELFAFDYPAPGDPEVAELVAETVKPRWVGLDVDSWGLDHGTWSVLAHMFPEADMPVVQLSINALQSLELPPRPRARLAPLRDQDVLIIGSGNVVHNLRRIAWDEPTAGSTGPTASTTAARTLMRDRPGDILRLAEHPDFDLAVPTPDHFIPLLYIAAVAAAADGAANGAHRRLRLRLAVDGLLHARLGRCERHLAGPGHDDPPTRRRAHRPVQSLSQSGSREPEQRSAIRCS